MAFIKGFQRKHMDRNSLHKEINATYTSFERDGRVLLQIDSYGTEERQVPGKKSQSIQIDKEGAVQLLHILKREFGLS